MTSRLQIQFAHARDSRLGLAVAGARKLGLARRAMSPARLLETW